MGNGNNRAWERLGLGVLSGKTCTNPIRVLGIDLGATNSTGTEVVWDAASGPCPIDHAERPNDAIRGDFKEADAHPGSQRSAG